MMSCREVNRILEPYLRGELSYTSRIEVQRHFAACASCARMAEQARDALDVSRSFSADAADPAPDDVPDSLLAAILVTSRRHV